MASRWLCKVSGSEVGPLGFQDLVKLIRAGELTEDDWVRRELIGDWTRVRDVVGLLQAARREPPDAASKGAEMEARGQGAAPARTMAAPGAARASRPGGPPVGRVISQLGREELPTARAGRRRIALLVGGAALAIPVVVGLLSAWQAAARPRFPPPRLGFVARDTSDPGPYVPEDHFARLDEDGDGQLVLEEFIDGRISPTERQQASDIFHLSDRNHDQRLSLEEFRSKPQRACFRQLDGDGDGGLDLDEFHRGDMGWASASTAGRAFQLVDQDGDWGVSFEEYQDRPPEAWFLHIDRNGDGRLSLDEYAEKNPGLVRLGRHKTAFGKLDSDGDGRLTAEEFGQESREVLFLKQDADGDDRLTPEEFTVWCSSPEAKAADAAGPGHPPASHRASRIRIRRRERFLCRYPLVRDFRGRALYGLSYSKVASSSSSTACSDLAILLPSPNRPPAASATARARPRRSRFRAFLVVASSDWHRAVT